MKKHVKIFLQNFGLGEQDFIPCLMCGQRAVDIHHLEPRGMGGSKTKDRIENLVELCRKCHTKAENASEFNNIIKQKHLKRL